MFHLAIICLNDVICHTTLYSISHITCHSICFITCHSICHIICHLLVTSPVIYLSHHLSFYLSHYLSFYLSHHISCYLSHHLIYHVSHHQVFNFLRTTRTTMVVFYLMIHYLLCFVYGFIYKSTYLCYCYLCMLCCHTVAHLTRIRTSSLFSGFI